MILLKGLFFLFLAGLFLIAAFVASVALKIYRMHRQFKQTASQEWQTGEAAPKKGGSATVSDRRDPAKANRKIFSDDEGEYVDYVEE